MLSRQEIIDKLIGILEDAKDSPIEIKNFTEDSKILTDFGLSSVGMLYMVIAIEETFNIEFDDVNINDFVTLKDVVDYITSKL